MSYSEGSKAEDNKLVINNEAKIGGAGGLGNPSNVGFLLPGWGSKSPERGIRGING